MMSCARRCLAIAVVASSPLAAQGTLSTQGLGFPPGQLGTRALSMGGSIGEADPWSPLNPAAVGMLLTSLITMQVEPEYRQLKVGSATQNTSIVRFPQFMGSMPVGSRWGIMLSASTLFDRTWSTTSRDSQVIGPDTIRSTVSRLSDGSLADVRVATSYAPVSWLRIGLGLHTYTGRDAIRQERLFHDTVHFEGDTIRTTLWFSGHAISVGAMTYWPRKAALGVTYRRGGSLRTFQGDALAQTGSAPDHIGLTAEYLGIEGTTLAVRLAKDGWSRLDGIAPSLNVHEGWDIAAGADVQGPRFAAGFLGMRVGFRNRTLPFSTSATVPVTERTFSGGFGFPLALQRAELNVAVLRASRSGPVGVFENAWTISTGFSVRP